MSQTLIERPLEPTFVASPAPRARVAAPRVAPAPTPIVVEQVVVRRRRGSRWADSLGAVLGLAVLGGIAFQAATMSGQFLTDRAWRRQMRADASIARSRAAIADLRTTLGSSARAAEVAEWARSRGMVRPALVARATAAEADGVAR